MKHFRRAVVFVSLIAFLGLTAAESVHSHQAFETASHCSLCIIAHQTPAPAAAVSFSAPTLQLSAAFQPSFYITGFIPSFELHALSPPIA